jgi:hypothetical protein
MPLNTTSLITYYLIRHFTYSKNGKEVASSFRYTDSVLWSVGRVEHKSSSHAGMQYTMDYNHLQSGTH